MNGQNKVERLQGGEIIISKEPGNSMEPILHSREPVILTPMTLDEALKYLRPGDICLSKFRGTLYTHKVYALDEKRGVKIGNNHGHENGWTKQVYAKAHLIPRDKQGNLKEYLEDFIKNWKGYDGL